MERRARDQKFVLNYFMLVSGNLGYFCVLLTHVQKARGHRQKGSGTVMVSRRSISTHGVTMAEWQKTPKQACMPSLLTTFSQKNISTTFSRKKCITTKICCIFASFCIDIVSRTNAPNQFTALLGTVRETT